MSWLKIPTSFISPVDTPVSGHSLSVIYKGIDADAGTYRFYGNGLVWFCDLPYFVIADDFCFHIKFSGKEFIPIYEDVNNRIYFRYYTGMTGSYEYIWYSGPVFGWIYGKSPGVYPTERYNEDTEEWEGDFFYTVNFATSFTFTDDMTVILTPRGSIKETGTEITATLSWTRWQQPIHLSVGEYVAKGDAKGIRYFGNPYWTNGSGNFYYRSVSKTDGYFTYSSIHYDSDHEKWIIGTFGAETGWYEGEEPSKTESVVFTRTYPEGIEGTSGTITITFSGYDSYDYYGE